MTRFGPRGVHALWLALIGCALLLRALIPAGWMPTRTAEGFVLELCSGRMPGGTAPQVEAAQALLDQALAGTADHRDNSDGAAKDQPCTFAGLTPVAPPPAVLAPLAPVSPPVDLPPPALTAAIGRGLPAPPPPSTGPPLTA